MIDEQVQEVLDLLNSELHGRVDYTLFSKIFDAVAVIGTPEGVKLVADLPFATGEQLDRIADEYDIVRNIESDASLRNRILSKQREVLK